MKLIIFLNCQAAVSFINAVTRGDKLA